MPTGACGSASYLPKSVRRTISRSPTKSFRAPPLTRARQFPGQEQQVWEYYRKNPQALASLRAPIYEEKVVDFIVELANVTDKPVSRDELFREEEDDEKK